MKDLSKFSAVIIGAGDATGSAITKKFASKGYKVCPVRRPKSISKLIVYAMKSINQEDMRKALVLMQEVRMKLLIYLGK